MSPQSMFCKNILKIQKHLSTFFSIFTSKKIAVTAIYSLYIAWASFRNAFQHVLSLQYLLTGAYFLFSFFFLPLTGSVDCVSTKNKLESGFSATWPLQTRTNCKLSIALPEYSLILDLLVVSTHGIKGKTLKWISSFLGVETSCSA